MKKYRHTKKDKESTEKVSFYVALTICVMAVGLAIWSAYSSFGDSVDESDGGYFSSLSSTVAAAAQPMTGVTEGEPGKPTAAATVAPTEAATVAPTEPATSADSHMLYQTATLPHLEDAAMDSELSALQAVLKVADSLIYPVKSRSVLKQYSEDAVYSKTMRDYRAHTGCDFVADDGENVYAMCPGTVKNISVSELYGVILEVGGEGFSVYYCGMSSELNVDKGDEVTTGDTLGTVAQIPCESEDDPHIHVEIRVGNKLIDPLNVINNNS